MAHNLDITRGTASFVTANTPAWHGLGQVFDGELTVGEGMVQAHLNGWKVRKLPLFATETVTEITEDGVTTREERFEEEGVMQVRRTNPITGASERLGSVGSGFTHIQNEEAAEFFETLLGNFPGATLQTMGALDGGRRTFMCAKLPEGVKVGGEDAHDLYIALLNGHAGDTAFRPMVTPVRIVCANTEAAAIRRAKQSWSIRHTSGAKQALEEAMRSTEKAWAFIQAFAEDAGRMIDTPATFAHVEKAAEKLWPLPTYLDPADPEAGARAKRTRIERIEVLRGLWEGPTTRPIADTRWAAYNVLTEYVDHHAGAAGETPAEKAQARAASALLRNGFTIKENAWKLLH